ncbi:hypothetical protein EB118_22105 [bacterium]|nr:hypothetical protein [Actinomycetota bacterium]NDG32750.1 hypothetical protein [bacterium]
MADISLQQINLGGYANDGTGDDLRTAFAKVIYNFDLLKLAIPTNLAEDTNPTLGGNLNINGKNLLSNNNVLMSLPTGKKFEVNTSIKTPLLEGQVSDITNHNLDDLNDVEITMPTSGQSLVFDGDKWVAGVVGSSFVTVDGGSSSTIYIIEPGNVIDGGYA